MWKWILIGALLLYYVPLFVLLGVQGDVYSFSYEFLAPKQQSAIAKSYVEAARHHDFSPIQKSLNRKYKSAQLPSVLAKVAAQFPAGEPQAIRLVAANWMFLAKGQKIYTFIYEYDYPHDNVVAKVVISEGDGLTILEGLNVSRLDAQMRQASRFGFQGKTPFHFLYVAAMLAAYVFTLVSVFYCMKTPIPRFKWAWVIFVLLGFVTFRLNWATGNISLQPISFLICSIGFTKAPLGPVILQLAIPVGAIVFWLRRRKWLEASEPVPDLRGEAAVS